MVTSCASSLRFTTIVPPGSRVASRTSSRLSAPCRRSTAVTSARRSPSRRRLPTTTPSRTSSVGTPSKSLINLGYLLLNRTTSEFTATSTNAPSRPPNETVVVADNGVLHHIGQQQHDH